MEWHIRQAARGGATQEEVLEAVEVMEDVFGKE
jgi:alkylhydroperoxidase/carboxymuconolactone decarboxylase family protein YurZ